MAILLYNPPSGTIAGCLLGTLLAILAGVSLGRHRKAAAANGYLRWAVGFGGSSALAFGLTAYAAYVRYSINTYSQFSDSGSYPHAALWASIVCALLVGGTAYAVYNSGRRRKPIQMATAATALFASLTLFVETLLLQGYDGLVVGETIGWMLTALASVSVLAAAYYIHQRWISSDVSTAIPLVTAKSAPPRVFVEALHS
jgi:hypothetical protein